MAKNKYLLLSGIFIFLAIAFLDLIFKIEGYFIETFLFIILLVFFYKTYKKAQAGYRRPGKAFFL